MDKLSISGVHLGSRKGFGCFGLVLFCNGFTTISEFSVWFVCFFFRFPMVSTDRPTGLGVCVCVEGCGW